MLGMGLLFFLPFFFFSSSSLNRMLRLRLSASMGVPLSNNVRMNSVEKSQFIFLFHFERLPFQSDC